MMLIYKILNLVNNKSYIGSAVNGAKRWREHKYHLNRQTHKNPHLQAAWNKYSEEKFEFIIIELVTDISILIKREQFYLDLLKPEYNLALVAGSRFGVPMPQSAKDKIGENSKRHMTGRKMLPQTKKALALAIKGNQFRKGHKQTIEEKAKRALANTGQRRTLETKLKMSLAAKLRWEAYRAAK